MSNAISNNMNPNDDVGVKHNKFYFKLLLVLDNKLNHTSGELSKLSHDNDQVKHKENKCANHVV